MKKKIYSLSFVLLLYTAATAQNVGVDVASPVEKLDVAGAIRVGNTTNANAGTLRWTGTAFEGYNGSAWLNLGSPGGITSLNTLTGAVQTFAIGTAGTAPAFSPAGTVHTLNIPFASTSGVTGGILSNTQYTTLLNGILPSGLTGQTLRHNGTTWVANSVIYNDGTNVGIGQTPGSAYLDVAGTNGGTTSLQLRSGNPGTGGTSSQITFGYNGTENYRQAIKTRHQSSGTSNAIDFYVWDQPNDIATTIGTLNVMSITGLNNGSVGIGVNAPGAQLHTTGSVRFAGLTAASQTSAVMTDGSGNLSTRALNPVAFSGTLANHTAGTGLSGSVYDGSGAQTWSVAYGTTAGTAVQGNQAATITAGNGLTGGISADALGDGFTSTLAVGAGTAIQVNADDIAVKFDNSTITTNGSGQLQVAYGSTAATAVQGNQTATITAGNGLTGGISADALGDGFTSSLAVGAGTAIQVNADDIAVKFDNSTITTNGSGQLQVANIPSGDGDYIQNLTPNNTFGTGQAASYDVTGSGEIGGSLIVSGNIGIGTTVPGQKLHVSSAGTSGTQTLLGVLEAATSKRPVLLFSEGGPAITAGMSIEYDGTGSGGNNKMHINSIAGTPNVTFTSGGSVGIGSTSPRGILDVHTTTASDIYLSSLDDYNFVLSGGDVMKTVRNDGTATAMHLQYANSANITMLAGGGAGNVGIGISSPNAILNIKGNGTGGYRGIVVQNSITNNTSKGAVSIMGARRANANVPFSILGTWDSGSGRGAYIGGGGWDVPDATELAFFTAPSYSETINTGVERMRIQNDGNVGIGTTGPASLVHIKGASFDYSPLLYIESTTAATDWNQTAHVMMPNMANGGKNMIAFGKTYATGETAYMYYIHHGTTAASRGIRFGFYGADDLVSITGAGNVGIGLTGPTYRLQLPNINDNTGKAQARAWDTYSDERIKSNRSILDYGLNTIMQLKPVRYFQHDSEMKGGKLIINEKGANSFGFLAQELYKIIPEMVSKPEDDSNTLWGVDYDKIGPVLVKAMQEQQAIIEKQNTTIEQMKQDIEALKQQINK